jgi:hypothetical protein
LPEEWLIERIQQVGANSRKPLSPSFVAVCRTFAAVSCNLRYIFVTATKLNEHAPSYNLPEAELIAPQTLMINQCREAFC